MKTFKFELSPQHTQALLSMLGEMPTKSGAWVILTEIHSQVEAQQKEDSDAMETAPAAPADSA